MQKDHTLATSQQASWHDKAPQAVLAELNATGSGLTQSEAQASAETRIALDTDVVPRARMAVNAALSAYGAGQNTLVSVVEATRALWDARSELIMAQTAESLARVRLDRAVGESPGERGIP